MGVSAPSLHRESTDCLIHNYIVVSIKRIPMYLVVSIVIQTAKVTSISNYVCLLMTLYRGSMFV